MMSPSGYVALWVILAPGFETEECVTEKGDKYGSAKLDFDHVIGM